MGEHQRNMAKLFTKHDPMHVHKILGFSALLHLIYKCYMVIIYGTAFPRHEPVSVACTGLCLHLALSWSSLLLPLPMKRNFSAPMIWGEFRLHSITFATRHLVCALV